MKRETINNLVDALRAKGAVIQELSSDREGVPLYKIQIRERKTLRYADELADVLAGRDTWLGKV